MYLPIGLANMRVLSEQTVQQFFAAKKRCALKGCSFRSSYSPSHKEIFYVLIENIQFFFKKIEK